MKEFFVTFGQKYRYEPHPHGGHPDGWFVIEAKTSSAAHDLAFARLGNNWSFLYEESNFNKGFYPRGELLRIRNQPAATKREMQSNGRYGKDRYERFRGNMSVRYKLHPEWELRDHYYPDHKSPKIFVVEHERRKTKSGRTRPYRRIFRVFKIQDREVWNPQKFKYDRKKSVFCKIPCRSPKGRDLHYIYNIDRFRELFDHFDGKPTSNHIK